MAKNDDRLRRLLELVEKGYIRFATSMYNDSGTGVIFSIHYPNDTRKRLTGPQVDALIMGVRLAEAKNLRAALDSDVSTPVGE